MNWERPLAIALDEGAQTLVPGALEARDFCRSGKYGRALEVLWEMLRTARRLGSLEREAFVLIHMGKVYRNWMWDVALKFFRNGLFVSQACGFTAGEMTAYHAIGEVYHAWGQENRAADNYNKSLEMARRLGDPSARRDILLDILECYEAKGSLSLCDAIVKQAIRLEETLGTPGLKEERRTTAA